MNIFKEELKRQFKSQKSIRYIILAILIAIFWAWFIIGGYSENFLMTGAYKGYKGIDALNRVIQDRSQYAGEMEEKRFERSGKIFLESLDADKDGGILLNDELLKNAMYADMLLMQKVRFNNLTGESAFSYDDLGEDFGKDFYNLEDKYYKARIERDLNKKSDVKLANEYWNDVKKPYNYYPASEVLRDGIEHMQIFNFILAIMIIFVSSGIVVNDKESELDEIILSTRNGRNKILMGKIAFPIIIGVIIYIFGMGTYIGILKYFITDTAFLTSIQIFSPSIMPYNLGQIMKIMLILGLLGSISVAIFSLLLSSIFSKENRTIGIGVIGLLFTFYMSISGKMSGQILEKIQGFLPGRLIFSFFDFSLTPIINIFGKSIWIVKYNIITSIIFIIISIIISGYRFIRR